MRHGQGAEAVSVGVCGALVREGRVLMVQQAYNNRYGKGAGCWFVPGGYVKPGETLAEAVERELREETGLVGRVRGLLGIRERAGDLVVIFLLEFVGGELAIDRRELLDARFVSRDELDELAPVMGLSREIARTALTAAATAVPQHAYRPEGVPRYVLYLAPGE
ncbi:MAG: NADH pyrophosphatase [Bacillota bacterium]|nr:NADH pyrophosphatase [Bacillota bacterium]REJ34551.1 MAG: NADH pyrophosphatase [Bacillota bacterium]